LFFIIQLKKDKEYKGWIAFVCYGEIVDGGSICLDCMREETRNALLNNVNQNQEVSIFDNGRNADYKKINPQILIDEYKKLTSEELQTYSNLALSNAKTSQL